LRSSHFFYHSINNFSVITESLIVTDTLEKVRANVNQTLRLDLSKIKVI